MTFVGKPMTSLAEAEQFERAEDVARVVWREYARAAHTDTVSISVRKPGFLGATAGVTTLSFYPDQLSGSR